MTTESITKILPAGTGAWDVTSYPFGGDFIRPKKDLVLCLVKQSEKPGWLIGKCAYPPRNGVRTICFQGTLS